MRTIRNLALCGVIVWLEAIPLPAAVAWQQRNGFRVAKAEPSLTDNKVGFSEMPAVQTQIQFSNSLEDQTVLKNQNLMLGSGVAAGDIDGDGWCDLYFCAINGSNALYRNRGAWRFENVTESAGVALPNNASTGAVFADVNGDGRLDLLVSSLGNGVRLLLNEGGGKFRDTTANSGLSSRAGSMTMALGDVDGDRDLDIFVCNYGAQAILKSGVDLTVKVVNGRTMVEGPQSERVRLVNGKLIELGEPPVLFINEGAGSFRPATWGAPRFVDEDGRPFAAPPDFGLSAQMRDVNGDGAPDIYVCNDFDTPDRFWINDGSGNFRLIPRMAQRSQSYASMGVDFADVDRDGHLDFFVVEMLAADRARRLWQLNALASTGLEPGSSADRPEVTRNTFFHARGDGTFEEIANYAGVAASDWSWQGSFLDVDLDGFEDLLVVNGHLFDVQDRDVPPRSRKKEDVHAQLLASPRLFVPKRAWRNTGDLRFEDRSAAWGFNDTNICHGIALADLDNDGDLDVIANRMNAGAWLLRNECSARRVTVRLKGNAPNTFGIGAKITLRGGAVSEQTQEIISGGKYLSCDDATRVFACTSNSYASMILEVNWRSGGRSVITNVQGNFVYEILESSGTTVARSISPAPRSPLFVDASERLSHTHTEPEFDDFRLQPLLAKKLSQRGPGLCVNDLDGDGREDLVIGAGRGGRLTFYRGDGRGGFTLAAQSEPVPDDVLAVVEWTPGFGLRGVLVTLANYESARVEAPLLFVTLEKSELVFHAATESPVLSQVRAVGSCLAVADFDADGDLDVFVGGNAITGRYPEAAPSWLLRCETNGLRVDEGHSTLLKNSGLVSSALWSDLDDDGWPELVLACEWGPVRIFKNTRGQLKAWNPFVEIPDQPFSSLDSLTGWWMGIAAVDLNEDGRMDLVVGNWGLNGPQCATAAQPLEVFYGDFFKRSTVDVLETEYDAGGNEPMVARSLTDVALHLPALRERFFTHRAWAAATAKEVLIQCSDVRGVSAMTLATTAFLNRGDRFEARLLPRDAQLSPASSVVTADFNGDGHEDVFLSQNFFALRSDHPRCDAGRGLLLVGDGRGGLAARHDSGVTIYGEQRGAVVGDFDRDGRPDLAVAQNAGATKLYRNATAVPGIRVELEGPPGNPRGMGARLHWTDNSSRRRVREIRGGSGWLSAGSSVVQLPSELTNRNLRVRWPGGRETTSVIPHTGQNIRIEESGRVTAR